LNLSAAGAKPMVSLVTLMASNGGMVHASSEMSVVVVP
jgi:hypothetical protein